MIRRLLFLYCLFWTACMPGTAQAQPTFTSRVVKDNLFIPWEIIYGPDDHIWFTQKNGYICRLDPADGHTDTLYHEANTVIFNNGEGGMLGMALHPDFPGQPYVYVAYEYLNNGNYTERIARYTYANNILQQPLVIFDNITGATFHNGCRLLIVSNYLFITTGDAQNTSNAQNMNSVNGKILRINLDGSIPADNPIANSPLWSWGHRNPQGLAYANGMLYSSEHGPDNDDEINIIKKGRNYGWPNVEGYCNLPAEQTFCADSNVAEPIQTWTPTIAPSGLAYYSQPMFPSLQGSLLLASLKDQHLYQLQLNNAGDSIRAATVLSGVNFGRLRAICISPSGSIFISTSNSPSNGQGAFTDKIIELYDPSYTHTDELPNGEDWTLYPVPTPGTLYIRGAASATWPIPYQITDLQGSILVQGTLMRREETIPVDQLLPGMYFFRAASRPSAVIKRFIRL